MKLGSKIFKENIIFILLICLLIAWFNTLDISDFAITYLALFLLTFFIIKLFLYPFLEFSNLTIPSFFLLVYIMVMIIPGIFVFEGMRHSIKYDYLIAILSPLITIPIGVIIANSFSKNPQKTVLQFVNSEIQEYGWDKIFYKKFYSKFIIASIAIVIMVFYFTPMIQLIEIIKEYPTKYGPEEFRFAAVEAPKVVQWLLEILRRIMIPFIVIFTFYLAKIKGGTWTFNYYLILLISIFISAITLDRGPTVALFGTIAIAYLLEDRKANIFFRFSKIVLYVFLAVLSGALISFVQYSTDISLINNQDVIERIWYVLSYRIGTDAPVATSLAFEIFDDNTKQLYGATIRLFTFFTGNYYESLEGLDSRGEYTNAPASFVGDLWRNFGWNGVVIGSIVVGFIFQKMQLLIFRKKSIIGTALRIIMLIGTIWIIWGNLFGVMTISVIIFGFLAGAVLRYNKQNETFLFRLQ